MTIVQVTCPECGNVEVYARDVTVRCCDETMHFAYRFHCPKCSMPIVKDAADGDVTLLLAGDARTERWHLPLEVYEHPVGAAAINNNDLLDFHEAMARLPTAT
jgi:hypothetical protein